MLSVTTVNTQPIQGGAALLLGVIGLVAMIFPRLGFFVLPLATVLALGVAPVRRALTDALPGTGR